MICWKKKKNMLSKQDKKKLIFQNRLSHETEIFYCNVSNTNSHIKPNDSKCLLILCEKVVTY